MPAKGVGVRAIVVAGGDAVGEDAARLAGADLVIAADSGAEWLAGLGIRPDLLIGDMDSVDPGLLERLRNDGVTLERHPPDKDASDAELAIVRAISDGADEVVIVGALGGGRVDHELANLLLLADSRWRGNRLRIVRGGTTAQAVHGGETLQLSGAEGDLVTLLAVGGDAWGVRSKGLRYPVAGEALGLGRSRGLSNQVEQAPASVLLERGTLLVVETETEGVGR
jgi:thiamine pyrophosphokinase